MCRSSAESRYRIHGTSVASTHTLLYFIRSSQILHLLHQLNNGHAFISSAQVRHSCFHYLNQDTAWFGPIGRASKLPGLILGPQDQAGRARENGPGGGIGREGPGKAPMPPNLTFSTTFEPGRAVVEPWGHSLLRPARTPRTFIFL